MDISTISIGSLIAIISILIIFAIVEINLHLKSLSQIPIRIHVNGARGKSSVVRLIASGLREGGFKTYAKTTGTIPRIINDNGDDVELHRLRSASIGEQIKLIRYFGKQKPDAVVMECMAVSPQYQWISEHRIIRSTLSVITNVRRDHIDEMGLSNKEIAYSLSNTIPFNSKVVTSEKNMLNPFEKIAEKQMANIFESLIGAMYLDGGIEPCRRLILDTIWAHKEEAWKSTNYKGKLIEYCHSKEIGNPVFLIKDISGPDHYKTFEIQVKIGSKVFASGLGTNKKTAEQIAAQMALEELGAPI